MAITFEGYERRINQINKTLNEYGIKDIEEAKNYIRTFLEKIENNIAYLKSFGI